MPVLQKGDQGGLLQGRQEVKMFVLRGLGNAPGRREVSDVSQVSVPSWEQLGGTRGAGRGRPGRRDLPDRASRGRVTQG